MAARFDCEEVEKCTQRKTIHNDNNFSGCETVAFVQVYFLNSQIMPDCKP